MSFDFERVLKQGLENVLPRFEAEAVSKRKKIAGGRHVDFYLRDKTGKEYYVEVKSRNCNRIDIGQAVEYKALISQSTRNAELIVVCKSVSREIRQILRKAGIIVLTFDDLHIQSELPGEIPRQSSKSLSPIEERAYFRLLREGVGVVTAASLASLLGLHWAYSKNILSSMSRKGAVHRIGRGKYVLVPPDLLYDRRSFVGDPVALAGQILSSTYYVSHQSAAHIHGLAEQLPFVTTVAVPKAIRPIKIGSGTMKFVTMRTDRFDWGIQDIKYGSTLARVSDPHRTVLDCVERPELCAGLPEVARIVSNALERADFDQMRLAEYAQRLRTKAVAQRLGFILERTRKRIDLRALKSLRKMKSDYNYPLDPRLPNKGKVSAKWNIIANASLRG